MLSLLLLISVPILLAWLLIRLRQHSGDISHNVLFVSAHPDDELMFFGPTLLQEMRARIRPTDQHSKVHLLCLSQGDFYGDGHKRIQELTDACHYLRDYCANFSSKQNDNQIFSLKVVQDEHLPDSPGIRWSPELVRQYILDYIAAHRISKMITFDQSGVSGHSNHVSIYHSLNESIYSSVKEVWYLETVPLWRKYLSWGDLLFTGIQSLWSANWQVHLASPRDYFYLVQSLRKHKSQMLWFRYLYALSSRYMVINSLARHK